MSLNKQLPKASRTGDLKEVKSLIEHGADIHAYGDLAFLWASRYGHLEIVKYLIEQGADIHVYDDVVLHLASDCGHTEVVRYLESIMLQEKRIKGVEKLK